MATTTTDISLSAEYTLLTPPIVSLSAEYTLRTTKSRTLSAKYAISLGSTSLTKSAEYVIGRRTNLAKLAAYSVRSTTSLMLPAYYEVANLNPLIPEIRRFNILSKLLADSELPISFNKDAQAARGITLHYSGGQATVTVLRHHLLASVDGGSGLDLVLDLEDFESVQDLVNEINLHTGYTCTVAGDASISPMLLIPIEDVDIATTTASLYVFTSLLWKILIVAAWAIEDSLEHVEDGLKESAQPTSDTDWLDLWGETFGNVLRLPLEPDPNYKARMMREVQRLRLSKNGIINAVLDATGVQIDISYDQHDLVMVMGDPIGKPLVDRLHVRPIIYIFRPPDLDPSLLPTLMAAVERNRAAGIMPYYPPFSVYFVTSPSGKSISSFFYSAVGAPMPTTVIAGGATDLNVPRGAITSKDKSVVWVADSAAAAVYAWPTSANGNVAPAIDISGGSTTLSLPFDVAEDLGGKIYVANGLTVAVFAAGANGNAVPVAVLGTGLFMNAISVTVDATARLFVADEGANVIHVYAPNAHTGDAPVETISIDSI